MVTGIGTKLLWENLSIFVFITERGEVSVALVIFSVDKNDIGSWKW